MKSPPTWSHRILGKIVPLLAGLFLTAMNVRADPFLLQTENADSIGNGRWTFTGEGGLETGSIPDCFISPSAALDFLDLFRIDLGVTGGIFPNQTDIRLDSVDASIRWQIMRTDAFGFQAYGKGSVFLGKPIWTAYAGSLSGVVYVLSPRAEGGYDVEAGAAGHYIAGPPGFSLFGDFNAAFTGGRDAFPGLATLGACFRLFANIGPAYSLNPSWSAAIQNRFTFWFSRGFMYEILPQIEYHPIPGLAVSAGLGIPALSGNVWRLIAGVRWTPDMSKLAAATPEASGPPAAPPAESLEVIKEDGSIRIRVYINFLGDRSDLYEPQNAEFGPKNRKIIGNLVVYLKQFPTHQIAVEGHTNRANFKVGFEKEQETEMLPLAKARAEAVLRALADAGIEMSRLKAVAIGGLKPLAKFEDMENNWKNRRVEIVLTERK